MADEMDLTHDEIWDDSALVDSWNQALEEYKKYHSIYAGHRQHHHHHKEQLRGATPPPERPRAAAPASAPGPDAADVAESQNLLETNAPQVVALRSRTESTHASNAKPETAPGPGPRDETSVDKVNVAAATAPSNRNYIGVASPPAVVLGSVKDEGLKSLLMAWYYAGYYTGLYEGQQQQSQQSQQGHEGDGSR